MLVQDYEEKIERLEEEIRKKFKTHFHSLKELEEEWKRLEKEMAKMTTNPDVSPVTTKNGTFHRSLKLVTIE